MTRDEVAQALRHVAELVDAGKEVYDYFGVIAAAHPSFWDYGTDHASRVIGLLLAAEIVETEGLP